MLTAISMLFEKFITSYLQHLCSSIISQFESDFKLMLFTQTTVKHLIHQITHSC